MTCAGSRSTRTPKAQVGSLRGALAGADVFVGVSAPNILTGDDIATMADDAVVFALANPDPEVDPAAAREHATVVATGRSDYPNQINNVLAFPGVFRGLLDAHSREITTDLLLAAARALASTVGDDELNANYIVPSVFNPDVAKVGREGRPGCCAGRRCGRRDTDADRRGRGPARHRCPRLTPPRSGWLPPLVERALFVLAVAASAFVLLLAHAARDAAVPVRGQDRARCGVSRHRLDRVVGPGCRYVRSRSGLVLYAVVSEVVQHTLLAWSPAATSTDVAADLVGAAVGLLLARAGRSRTGAR